MNFCHAHHKDRRPVLAEEGNATPKHISFTQPRVQEDPGLGDPQAAGPLGGFPAPPRPSCVPLTSRFPHL